MEAPLISVVIAARNEGELLGTCLEALTRQAFPHPYEIIVVDNASDDATAQVASRFGCRVIHEPRIGQLFAKHRGAAEAAAPVVAVLDADCVPVPGWLAAIHESLSGAGEVVAVTCPYRFAPGLPGWGRAYVAVVHTVLIGRYRLFQRSLRYVVGGNVAFRKACYDACGGYPLAGGIAQTELGLAARLSRYGLIRHAPRMVVTSSPRRFQEGARRFLHYKLVDYFLTYLRSRQGARKLESTP